MRLFYFTLLCILFQYGTLAAQSGLEDVIIEKYYISDANDSGTSLFPVPAGAVTYRIYVDLATNWGLQAIYGATNSSTAEVDTFIVRSTQPFFNNEDRGRTFGYLINTNNIDENTVSLDSWFTTGRPATTSSGVLKPEDTNGGAPAFPNIDGLLQNDDPAAGIPISLSDGNIPGSTTTTWTSVGSIPTDLVIFDDLNLAGSEIVVSDGALTSFTTPLQGPNATNKVLIGQFTTAGKFSGQINLQLKNVITNETQQWVAETPGVGQFTLPALTWNSDNPPEVSITAPVNGAYYLSGQLVEITAEAKDIDSAIAQVEFFFDNISVGVDDTAPFEASFTAVRSGTITAIATGDEGVETTSAPVAINVNPYIVTSVEQYCNAETVCIPVAAFGEGIADVTGLEIECAFDVSKIVPTGMIIKQDDLLDQNLFNVDYSIDLFNQKMLISVFLSSTAPIGTTFTGTGDLLCIEFSKRPAFGAVDSTVISILSLTESYAGGGVEVIDSILSGAFTTKRNTTFLGSLAFWADGSPVQFDSSHTDDYLITAIAGANKWCDSISADTLHPDLGGAFTHDLNDGDYLMIDRDIDGATDVQEVINSFDALLVRKLLMEDPAFVPSVYEMMAMDVNMDGVISAGDVSQIHQRALLVLDEFRQEWNYDVDGTPGVDYTSSKDWLFIAQKSVLFDPAYIRSSSFPQDNGVGYSRHRVPRAPCSIWTEVDNRPEACPETSVATYIGILLGDVNGNYRFIDYDGVLK